jgi:hypothetical protein
VTRVIAIILHAAPGAKAGPLETAFAVERARNGERQARGFAALGAEVRVETVPVGGPPFGARLRAIARTVGRAGLIVLGSGSVPLAGRADRRAFVAAAAAGDGPVLTNNRHSSDIVALPAGLDLGAVPDLSADNGLPRWLSDRGIEVRELRSRWHLGVDLDSPLDSYLVRTARAASVGTIQPSLARAGAAADAVRDVARRSSAELLVAGRSSSETLRWLERQTAGRTRVLVEERGMRTAPAGQRPARSVLGLALDRDGPGSLGKVLAGLADAAILDSRVLIAHHYGRDESGWPAAEDRFASDLLLHERIDDPWLRALTRSAATAPIPVVLGGHTVVGPGLRLLLGGRRG